MHNDIDNMFQQSVVAKLTENWNLTKNLEEMQNGDDHENDDRKFIEKTPTDAEMKSRLKILKWGVQYRLNNFQKQHDHEKFINDL